jgi:hypothetical protein
LYEPQRFFLLGTQSRNFLVPNPYIRVHRRMQRHQGVQWSRWVPVVAVACAIPLVRDVWFGFLPTNGEVPVEQWAGALSAVCSRLANLIAAAVILHSYSDLVRGPDRAVLDVHPVRSRALVSAIALQTAKSRSYLIGMGAVLLAPLAMAGEMTAYFGALALLTSAWVGGLGVGFLVHLGGVWAAYSPALSALLDAIRGENPRMQAALIYAPGVALAFVGTAVEFGAIGLEAALGGWSLGWAWLAIPAIMGAIAWSAVGTVAERFYVRASLLLADVEGAWAQAETTETVGQVYLERVGLGRPELTRALRHGWRSLRIYATGGWILGLVVLVVSWNDPDAAVFWGGCAVVWATSVAARMAAGDPPWLDEALGVSSASVALARTLVALLYGLGVLAPVGLALMVRHGSRGAGLTVGLLVLSIFGAVSAAFAARLWRDKAVWAYAAFAVVAWAGFVKVMG